jgi:serine-type D-Ala-D-Ala carboxypeptidase/endopeptidase
MRSARRFCLLLFLLWVGAPRAYACDFTGIDNAVELLMSQRPGIRGVSVLIVKGNQPLYERYFGTYTSDTVEPIASATKWLSAAVIMKLVEEGRIDLDAPVRQYLSQFTGLKGTMTMRQMFSHTSGLPGQSQYINDRSLTLEAAADLIAANTSLLAAPGVQFVYGGVSMQVGGRVAEVVTGEGWENLFQSRIAQPLGMTATDYQGLGATLNPQIGGGARSKLHDYARFVQMLKDGGTLEGQRVLSRRSVDQMLRDQTNGALLVSSPADNVTRYGFGTWREVLDTEGLLVEGTDAGAFGFYAWINFEQDYFGIFMVRNLLDNVRETVMAIRSLTYAEITGCMPAARITGQVALESAVQAEQPMEFEFEPTDGSSGFTRVQTLLASATEGTGTFDLGGIPKGRYTLRVKGTKWLAKNVTIDCSNGNVSGVTVALLGGDANGDNSVDVLDLDVLIQTFDQCVSEPGYDDRADFNSDGCTDVLDLDLLVRYFDAQGDV